MRKKLLFLATVAIAALASCSKTEIRPEVESRDVHFVVNTAENEDVKSFIQNNNDRTYTPIWSNGDKLAIFVGTIDDKTTKPTGVLSNTNANGTTASFGGTIIGITESGTFKSFAPAAVFEKGYADGTIGINLASTQKPSKLTIDEGCDILVAKEAAYHADAEGNVVIDGLYLKRMFSIVKIALKGPATLNGEKVQQFSLTAPEGTVLTGRAAINLSTATIDNWTIKNNTVAATYAESAPAFGDATSSGNVVWLVVNPCTIAGGAKVVLAGETAGYTFSKEVTLSKDLVFPQSQLAVINLTLDETNFTEKQTENRIYVENFGKVTENKIQLQPSATGAVGTGVSENLTYVYSDKNTNIRFNGNGHSSTDPYLYIPQNESFVIYNLVVNEETSLALSAQVKTNGGTSKVKVSYKESSTDVWSVASVEMNATTSSFNTVQKVFFNIDSSVKSLDLKFESTNATLVDDIVLESFEDTRVKLDVPANLSANVDEAVSNKINLTWDVVNNAKSYEVVLSAEGKTDIVKTAESASLSVEGLEYSTLYSVKVKAISADVEKYIDSDYCAAVTVTTGVKPEGGSTTPVLLYTLTPTKGKNSSYMGNCDVTVNGIVWNLAGNSQQNPWRLGGKSITKVDRTLYSKTAYPKALTSIKVTFGTAIITVNSCKLVYSTNADFTDSKECNIAFKASSTVEVTENFPANAYYKLVLNVTNTTNSTKYVQLSKIEFFGLDN